MRTAVLLRQPIILPAPETVSDADLVLRARGGDSFGREVLYRRHAAYLLGMTARLLANRGEAEEVVQDTFVRAFVRLGSLRDPAAVRGWLAQIAVSLVGHRLRRARLSRMLGLDRGAPDATLLALAAPGAAPDERAELAMLDRTLGRIPADQRIAWMLRRVEGLELTEVASACGCSLATAKRRIAGVDALVARHVGGGAEVVGGAGGEP